MTPSQPLGLSTPLNQDIVTISGEELIAAPGAPTGSFIQHLPVELLLEIFIHVDLLDSWGPRGYVRGRGIANLMLVCRHWRELGCSTPDFWRSIDAIEPLSLVSLSLDRSRGCTIDVRIFYSEVTGKERSLPDEAIALALSQSSRIRSLHVNVLVGDFVQHIRPFLLCTLPALEKINYVPIRNDSKDTVDVGLSRQEQPFLRSLVLKQGYLPTPTNFWRTLRVMKLYEFPLAMSGPYSTRDFLAVLKLNVSLEELCLWYYYRDAVIANTGDGLEDHTPNFRTALVNLPRLRRFSIHGPYAFISDLLSHLNIPGNIPYVDIRSSSAVETFEHAYSTLIPDHLRFLLERMSAGVSCRQPWTTPHTQYTFCSPPDARTDVDLSHEMTAIAFGHDGGVDARPDISLGLRCLTTVLGWVPVRRLVLSLLSAPAGEDTYERVFDSFPSVEELVVCHPSPVHIAEILAALRLEQRDDGVRDMPRCPHLRSLEVHVRCPGPKVATEVAEALEESLRERVEGGLGLGLVCLNVWDVEPDSDERCEIEEAITELVARTRASVASFEYQYIAIQIAKSLQLTACPVVSLAVYCPREKPMLDVTLYNLTVVLQSRVHACGHTSLQVYTNDEEGFGLVTRTPPILFVL
ncbi:hypothetical protein C8Q74DRAFT_234851 [Fomes fomentarius]|nr:hypothetical protein C8Q74DRAFT_234851 [Fomes fomentarius]